MINCQKIKFKNHGDSRGNLVAIESLQNLPFDIKRIYYIYDVGKGVERGFHSHRDLEQVLIALNGKIKIRIKNDREEEIVELTSETEGLYIGPMIWREMFEFDEGATLLTLASHGYDENDYIRDYEQYLKEAKLYFDELEKRKNYFSSNNIYFEMVNETDADFILKLRTNPVLNKFISSTNESLENQKEWLKKYKIREYQNKEFYFKINNHENEELGFVRLYNRNYETKTITFGSFILKEDRPKYAALESLILATRFAFYYLEVEKVLLDVRIENERAKNLYVRFGFNKTHQTELDEFYELNKDDYQKIYQKEYKKYIKEKN